MYFNRDEFENNLYHLDTYQYELDLIVNVAKCHRNTKNSQHAMVKPKKG